MIYIYGMNVISLFSFVNFRSLAGRQSSQVTPGLTASIRTLANSWPMPLLAPVITADGMSSRIWT